MRNFTLSCLLIACFIVVTLSWQNINRPSISKLQMSSTSQNERRMADVTKDVVNKGLKATVSALSVFSIASAANAYGAVSDQKKEKKTVSKAAPKVLETELGIKYIELKKGAGAFPTPNDFVIINYSGFLANGKQFDTTEQKGRKPLSFRLGKNQVIPGIESILATMQPGGEVTCTIPAKFAYGEKGICIEGEGCIVQPGETLNYVIKLVNVGASYS
mmetsp:Transcript_4155/g.4299  ORF Transcript_4155/g.4299 Transcript_4155/m.4299 type:complete len:217 (-) Transcript_4155:191-841(-)